MLIWDMPLLVRQFVADRQSVEFVGYEFLKYTQYICLNRNIYDNKSSIGLHPSLIHSLIYPQVPENLGGINGGINKSNERSSQRSDGCQT